jgi:hypothetical protein
VSSKPPAKRGRFVSCFGYIAVYFTFLISRLTKCMARLSHNIYLVHRAQWKATL